MSKLLFINVFVTLELVVSCYAKFLHLQLLFFSFSDVLILRVFLRINKNLLFCIGGILLSAICRFHLMSTF